MDIDNANRRAAHFPAHVTGVICLLWFVIMLDGCHSEDANDGTDAIRPYEDNPFYWQYRGEPVLLLGGSDQDNLFNHPNLPSNGLESHLDLLVSAGGNYLRNTMSSRDEGSVWPFHQREDGLYDLGQWNEEYWTRFSNFLQMTQDRDIIVQIEVWAFHDFFGQYGRWYDNPWNPGNNITYSFEETTLSPDYEHPNHNPSDYFFTVPALANDQTVLAHQKRFIEKLLAISLEFDHVLYCITNEIHPPYSPEWGWFWARYIKEQADLAGKSVFVSEMFWQPDVRGFQHRASFDHPEIYDYFEASQISAVRDAIVDGVLDAELEAELHWGYLMHIRGELAAYPRPINHTKIYGADTWHAWAGSDQNTGEKFWRNIFAGSASSRFHRPERGIGLNETAQRNIRSMRMLTESLNIFQTEPVKSRLSGHGGTFKAYVLAIPGTQYAVYFPDSGTVDFAVEQGSYRLTWLNIMNSEWQEATTTQAGESLRLTTPGDGPWTVWLTKTDLRNQ